MISVTESINRVKHFARLERILAMVCITAPAMMIIGDNGTVRDSISAYYDMGKSVLFYVPLTVAFMLFVVNGVIKKQKAYNTILGVFLAGLVLFNHEYFPYLHFTFAALFFLGNAVVMVIFTSKTELWFKAILVAIIASALGAWGLGLISLFWAEWVSLGIIGWHYILESWGVID